MPLLIAAASVLLGGPSTAVANDDLEELRQLLLETQQTMNAMKADYDAKVTQLEGRIAELEGAETREQATHDELEESVLQQRTLTDEFRSEISDRISLHGYYDFQYIDANNATVGTFIQNEFSIFLRHATPDEKWTIFSEIEFRRIDGNDYLAFRGDETDELQIETAWLEYRHNDLLRIRGGKLLLPQYWQTYHYPNLTLSTLTPLMVGKIFPKSIVALQVMGDWCNENERGLTYVLYAGNGGESETGDIDQNDDKTFGGRLTLHLAGANGLGWIDDLDLSASGNIGEDSRGRGDTVLGLDTQIRAGRLELLAEYARSNQDQYSERHFLAWNRHGKEAVGYYAQLAYRLTPQWHVYYRFDSLDLSDARTTPWDERRHTIGLNFRPRSNISLKLEWLHADPDGIREEYNGMAASAVFNF